MKVSPNQKIAVFAPSAPPTGGGGVASAHFHLASGLRQLGHEVTLLTFNEPLEVASEPYLWRAGPSPRLNRLLNVGVYLYLRLKGSKLPAYQLFDIVNAQPGALKACRALTSIGANLAIIPDHGACGLMLPEKRPPVILVVHHTPARFAGNPLLGEYCPIDAETATRLEQRVLAKVDAVVCPSQYMMQEFRKHYTFAGRVEVIPNMVDDHCLAAIPEHDVRGELGLAPEASVVYLPSAGSEFKGANYIFEIVRRLTLAAGEPLGFYLSGRIGARLAAELAQLPGNARVFAPGAVPMERNIAWLKGCSFGVSPTLIESFGMALLEAGHCGVPMVAFDVGGNAELIREGENGYLVPLLDIEALVVKATALFNRDHLVALRLAARRSVTERYRSNEIAGRYLELARDLRTSLTPCNAAGKARQHETSA